MRQEWWFLHKRSWNREISGLFLLHQHSEVERIFLRTPLNHTAAHITIIFSGQGGSFERTMSIKSKKARILQIFQKIFYNFRFVSYCVVWWCAAAWQNRWSLCQYAVYFWKRTGFEKKWIIFYRKNSEINPGMGVDSTYSSYMGLYFGAMRLLTVMAILWKLFLLKTNRIENAACISGQSHHPNRHGGHHGAYRGVPDRLLPAQNLQDNAGIWITCRFRWRDFG